MQSAHLLRKHALLARERTYIHVYACGRARPFVCGPSQVKSKSVSFPPLLVLSFCLSVLAQEKLALRNAHNALCKETDRLSLLIAKNTHLENERRDQR